MRQSGLRPDHPVVVTFLGLAVVAFMYFAAEVLRPLALAVLLSLALAPLVRRLERYGLPRTPAAALSVLLALGVLGLIGTVVWGQLNALADRLPGLSRNIEAKVSGLVPKGESTLTQLSALGERVTNRLENDTHPNAPARIPQVEVVTRPSFQERLSSALGPYLEGVALGFFVLILVLFLLIRAEDTRERIVQLFGPRSITKTTRTLDEIGTRISRYLVTFAAVNSTYGVIVGIGLAVIGVPLSVLWGFLAAVLRFIPYAGPATAFALPFLFSLALPGSFSGKPMQVLILFGVIEVLANSYLEPVIYGKTTGVSALGLLVAAMFWTWLWGAIGLLLSTPMTVCLAVLGKYVPSLYAFGTLLSEDTEIPLDAKLYQRLVALDEDGAGALLDELCAKRPRIEVFDEAVLPALVRAEQDRVEGDIDDRTFEFIRRVVREYLEELRGTPVLVLETVQSPGVATNAHIVGVASVDATDELVLMMLGLSLDPIGVDLHVVPAGEKPLQLSERIGRENPDVIVLSHVPPAGLTTVRYLVKRLRARVPQQPIIVGDWDPSNPDPRRTKSLTDAGATAVVARLAEARERIVSAIKPKTVEVQPIAAASANV